MELFYQAYSPKNNGHSPVVIIPGLFGSTMNWRSFARELGKDYHVIVIDQRNHGESEHADSHTYSDMVGDLLSFIDKQGFESITLCGHSMGGKVAMLFALLHPERVDKLAVLDIAPVEYSHSHAPYLKALMKIDLSKLQSRSDAEAALQLTIDDTPTRLFLMQSLVGRKGEYRWRLNLPVLLKEMSNITGFEHQTAAGLVNDLPVIVIIGGSSAYVRDEDHVVVKSYFPEAKFNSIDGAGHWLHAEQPKRVLNVLINFLK